MNINPIASSHPCNYPTAMSLPQTSIAKREQSLTLFTEIKRRLTARYSTDMVREVHEGGAGFVMEWRTKRDGSLGALSVRVTAKSNLRVEFTKNLAHGIVDEVAGNSSKVFLRLFGASGIRLMVHSPPGASVMYGFWRGGRSVSGKDDEGVELHNVDNIMEMLITLCMA